MSRETGQWVDERRAACLCDYGLPGFRAVVAIGADGVESLWLVRDALLNNTAADLGNPMPPHERVGPLPPVYVSRLERVKPRCGAPTVGGSPCRRTVLDGGKCSSHRGGQR